MGSVTAFDEGFSVQGKYEMRDELELADPGRANLIHEAFDGYTSISIIDRETFETVYEATGKYALEDVGGRRGKYNELAAARPAASRAEILAAVLPDYTCCHKASPSPLSSWTEADIESAWRDMAVQGRTGLDVDGIGQDDWDGLASMAAAALDKSEAYFDAGWAAIEQAIQAAIEEGQWDEKYPTVEGKAADFDKWFGRVFGNTRPGVTFAQQFPDARTAKAVAAQFGKGPDDIITAKEAAATTLDLSGNSLNSLTGLNAFPDLRELYCHRNNLTSLDLASNPALVFLDCAHNSLASLDTSASPALEVLHCDDNHLTSLDVTQNSNLHHLYCSENNLTSLDLSANRLTTLDATDNPLTSLPAGIEGIERPRLPDIAPPSGLDALASEARAAAGELAQGVVAAPARGER